MKFFERYSTKFILLSLLAIMLWFIAIDSSYIHESDMLEVSFVDVGQGDCVYIKTPSGERILIDGGDKGSYKKYIGPFLAKRRVKGIDKAVVSHFHEDHTSGIMEMMEKRDIDSVVVPELAEESEIKDEFLKKCRKHKIPVNKYVMGDILYKGKDGVLISVLSPNPYSFDEYTENDNSMVLMLEYKNKRILFTGDIGKKAEKELISMHNVKADIIKAGHHGSDKSSSFELLREVLPEFCVIQCGKNNFYGFPSDTLLKRLNRFEVNTLRCDLMGDITFIISEYGDIKIKTAR